MPSDDLSAAFARIADLACAHGDVPDDGSGIGTVEVYEVPDLDTDEIWYLAITDNQDREYDLPGTDRSFEISAFHAHAWYGNHLIAPAGTLTPKGGRFHVGREFERRTEDQLILSIEAELEELGYDFEPVEEVEHA